MFVENYIHKIPSLSWHGQSSSLSHSKREQVYFLLAAADEFSRQDKLP